MGRGRAKAKQTKVARELKYRSYDTDFSALQAELQGNAKGHTRRDENESSHYDAAADEYDQYSR